MSAGVRNALRTRAMKIGREFRALFRGDAVVRVGWRRVFLAEDDRTVRRAGEIALADLREFCRAGPRHPRALFANDPLEMARRLGRREVFDRIINYLNLDEAQVQQLMEIDDGI